MDEFLKGFCIICIEKIKEEEELCRFLLIFDRRNDRAQFVKDKSRTRRK